MSWNVETLPFGYAWLSIEASRTHFSFYVRTCESAHIVLSGALWDKTTGSIEIIIGKILNYVIQLNYC